MTTALIIVDMQNDFCEDGSLALKGGAELAAKIGDYIDAHGEEFDYIIATQDWHIDPGEHFSHKPDYETSWPMHCLAKTDGADIHTNLDTENFDAFFHKGHFTASPSGFDGILAEEDLFNLAPALSAEGNFEAQDILEYQDIFTAVMREKNPPTLSAWLEERNVDELVIAGVATDHCVLSTVLDAQTEGYDVTVLEDLTIGTNSGNKRKGLTAMRENGVTISTTLTRSGQHL